LREQTAYHLDELPNDALYGPSTTGGQPPATAGPAVLCGRLSHR